MKKTVNANLGGRVFQIDEDAYRMLDSYINSIRSLYQKEDPEGEIVEDFEQRLSDLLWEKSYGEKATITVTMTEEAIYRLGPLETIQEVEDKNDKGSTHQYTMDNQSTVTGSSEQFYYTGVNSEPQGEHTQELKKKFFRNPDDKWLGGILGGLGALMGVDPNFLRILFILLMFTLGNGILVLFYIVFWIFVPKAVSVEDKLRMEGRPVSSSEIWAKISEETSFAADTASKGIGKLGGLFKRKEIQTSETKSDEGNYPKHTKSSDTIMYWIMGIAVMVAIALSVIFLFDFVESGDFITSPWDWGYGITNFWSDWDLGPIGSFIIAVIGLLAIMILVMLALFIIVILPLGLIIRSNINWVLKIILCLIWLLLLGFITIA